MSGQLLSSKIIVVEEEPKVRSIQASPTAVLGAVGIAERGPIDKAVFCTSFEEYEQNFGGFTQDSDLALGAMGFFENGGSQLWVVRTAHHTDVSDPATITATRAFVPLDAGSGEQMASVLRVEGKDPGAYANRIEVEVRIATSGETDAFDLAVVEDGVYREIFPNLKMDTAAARYVETVVNDARNGSKLIRIIDQLAEAGIPNVQTVSLTGGDDGLDDLDDNDFIGSEAGKTGLNAFDQVQDLSLLIVPGRATAAVHNAMIRYCEVTRDGMVFAVLDPPENHSATEIVDYVQNTAALQELSEFGAIYWPRVQVLNPSKSVFGSADKIVVPPSGIITGVYARTDAARPGGVYDPPAGIENGRMFGVLGFETDEVLEETKRDLIYPKRINPLTTGPGLPRFIDGSRTLKSSGNFPYVAERRGVIFIEKSLKQGLQFARHKTNTENLRAQVRRTITAFLLIQMNNGAFQSKVPAKAFFVDVSETLNTPSVIFAGKLIARIGLATNKPAEFIILSISQDTRALEAELAAAGA
jgi:phage tail sheath protein FI